MLASVGMSVPGIELRRNVFWRAYAEGFISFIDVFNTTDVDLLENINIIKYYDKNSISHNKISPDVITLDGAGRAVSLYLSNAINNKSLLK